MSSSLKEEDIDNELLIEEVEKRPALYAKNLKQYSDIILKRRSWDEIVLHLFPTRSLSQEQKENAVKVIQRRWKSLRACFSRELRCQKDVKSGQAAPKRKRYVYFDKLLFLVPSMEPGRETSSNVTSLDEEAISENDSSTPPITRPTKEKKKNKSYEESLLEILRDKTNHQNIETPPDPDNYFALSLVPLLKSIPPDQKIDAQIAILNTLKYYTASSSNYYNNYNSTAATYIHSSSTTTTSYNFATNNIPSPTTVSTTVMTSPVWY